MRDSLVVELTLWGPATQHVDRSALEWDAERVVERFVVMSVEGKKKTVRNNPVSVLSLQCSSSVQ